MSAVMSVVAVVGCDDDEFGDSDNQCGGVVKASVVAVTTSAMTVMMMNWTMMSVMMAMLSVVVIGPPTDPG